MATKKVLLVEGKDDQHVFLNLMEHHNLAGAWSIRETQGVENVFERLAETFEVAIDESDTDRLGVVVDADTNMQGRWTRIRSILVNAGYKDVPDAPDATGTILRQTGKPVLGVWLMPDNNDNGMLEDFIRFLVPPTDTLWQQVEHCLNEVQDRWLFTPDHLIKAQIHTWLAWQKEPGKPFGVAIKSKFLDPEAAPAQTLVAWLRRLFVD